MDAKFRFSLKDGIFEIEGPESFVSSQLEAFGDIFRKALSEPMNTLPPPSYQSEGLGKEGDDISKSLEYSNVFEIHEGKVKVVSDIPGTSKKEKTKNATFICLFGKLQENVEIVPFDEIREICEDHGFYDKNNFSRYLKSDKQNFVISGPPKNQVIKLSAPGKKKAEALVSQLSS